MLIDVGSGNTFGIVAFATINQSSNDTRKLFNIYLEI
jgi:hypothetical protein